MKNMQMRWSAGVAGSALLAGLLAACGGGGGGDSATTTPPVQPPVTQTALTGTAASGAALLNATVTLYYSGGSKTCTTDANTGSFSCDTTGLSGPFLLTASGIVNGTLVMLTSASTKAGATANITPVTHAILATMTAADPASIDFSKIQSVLAANANALEDSKQAYQTLLADLMAATGNAGTDLISGQLIAGSSNLDKLLDNLQIVVTPAGIRITSTAGASDDNPKQLVLALTDDASKVKGSDKTQIPTTGTVGGTPFDSSKISFNSQVFSGIQQAFTKCFSSTAAQRMAAVMPAGCTSIVVDDVSRNALLAGVPGNYMHLGLTADQQFGKFASDDGMNNAKFSLPQIVRILQTDKSGNVQRVWVTLNYVRADGQSGSLETVAQLVTAASATDNGWRLVGNQRDIMSRVRPFLSRRMWLNPANQTTGTDAYLAELQLTIGSSDAAGKAVDFAIVTGPGLPQNGMLLRPSAGVCDTLTLTAQLAAGDVTQGDATVAAGKYGAKKNCATRVRLSGVAVDAAKDSSFTWPAGTNWLPVPLTEDQVKAVRPFAPYYLWVYQGGNVKAPAKRYEVLIQAGLVHPKELRSYKWQDMAAATLSTLDPASQTAFAGGASFPLSWVSKDGAVPVSAVNVQFQAGTDPVVGNSQQVRLVVPKTSMTVQVAAPQGTAFPSVKALTAAGNFSSADLHQQRSDGVVLSSVYEYSK